MGQTSVGSGSVLDKRYDTLRPSHQSPQSRMLNPLAIAMSHVFFSPCQIAICNSGDEARQPERCSVWHPAASCLGPNRACGTFFFSPLLPIMFPCGLSKPHQATMLPSQGNLGQALSLLIKKGIFFFCHPLGGRSVRIRGGRGRIINTAASASRCHRNGQLLCCFVFFLLLLDWDAQSFLHFCCGGCSCHSALPDL